MALLITSDIIYSIGSFSHTTFHDWLFERCAPIEKLYWTYSCHNEIGSSKQLNPFLCNFFALLVFNCRFTKLLYSYLYKAVFKQESQLKGDWWGKLHTFTPNSSQLTHLPCWPPLIQNNWYAESGRWDWRSCKSLPSWSPSLWQAIWPLHLPLFFKQFSCIFLP